MSATDVIINYYEILEVDKNAKSEEIREATKQMRRVWAKRQGLADQDRRHEAELRMKHIAEAERTLLDDAARKQYDSRLSTYRPPLPTAGQGGAATGESWVERTLEFLHVGDAHSANYAAREATTIKPQDDKAWALRAQTSLLLGNQRDAVFELNEALRINPNEPGHHFDLGTIFESAKQWGDALRAFERAAELEPGEQMYKVAQASVHIQTDCPSKALTIMDQVVKVVPDNPVYNDYLAMALHDTALEGWTKLRGGKYLITKKEQIAPTKTKMDRALALKLSDSALRKQLQELRKAADDAEKMKFRLPGRSMMAMGLDMGGFFGVALGLCLGWGFWVLFPLIMFAVNPAAGIVAILAEAAFLYYFAYKPMWHWNDKDSKELQVR